ncbi:Smr/MutS family protein [Bordetella bronchialis]|uniref:DNA mismatch repair protein MutS n=1 Tax=Bordetella bronchialis TaxID=463025 RepID=A0A193G007_9BORD|nr:Smr/MutS family protein [Bordetella bronchialis]ANN73337.1 DNA mismatch repair protein MutS [Bordetella bronchialis]
MRDNKAGLADLKRLHEQAQARRQEEQAAARQAQARQAQARASAGTRLARESAARDASGQGAASPDPADDMRTFEQAMRAVTPLRPSQRVVHTHRPDPGDIPAQRRAAALGETARRADAGVSDGDVAHLLSENGTAYVRADAAPDTARRLRRGEWQAGAELDLHGLRVEQARHAVLSFIEECLEHGIRCVRIVHGKGYGSEGLTPVLKDKARTWLVQKPDVIAFSEAPEREGGSGALLVLLRQREEARR